MDERHLLLLGVLMAESQHGYRINEFIENNLGRVSRMRRATAYALLERLEAQGLVRMELESADSYPPRKVYSITPAGKATFIDLLQSLLVRVEPTSSAADIALMFIDYLPPEKTVAALRDRAKALQSQIKALRATPSHDATAPGVDYAIERKLVMLEAERSWLEQTLDQITKGTRTKGAGNWVDGKENDA